MAKRRSAYDLPYEQVTLTAVERRRALLWWQSGTDYHPLLCPVCAAILTVAPGEPILFCPTDWCSYTSSEIPWGIYVAYQRFLAGRVASGEK